MGPVDIMNKPLAVTLLVAIASVCVCPEVFAVPHASRARLVALHPKLAPVTPPLQGRAVVRHLRTATIRRAGAGTNQVRKGEFTKLAPVHDQEKPLARSGKAASDIADLAANSMRVLVLVRVHPVGMPKVWRQRIDDGPQFKFDSEPGDDDCSCEAKRAHRLYKDYKYEESLKAYTELGEKSLAVYGQKNAQYASSLMWQGQCLHKLQREKEAHALWRESLAVYKKSKPKAKAVAWLQSRLAEIDCAH